MPVPLNGMFSAPAAIAELTVTEVCLGITFTVIELSPTVIELVVCDAITFIEDSDSI